MPTAIDKSKLGANWFERSFDRALAIFSPEKAIRIMRQREAFKAFAYRGGQRGQRDRTSATIYPNSSPESSIIQLERIQCMWQSRDLSDNFGVADYIYNLFCDYCIPDFSKIRWNTGNAADDKKLRERFLTWAGGLCDYLGRDTLNQVIRLGKRSQLRDGDVAFRCVSDDIKIGGLSRKCLRLQMIEADCIGSPFNVVVTPTYIGGLILDEETKRVLEYDIYDRPPMGSMYIPLAKVPACDIIHFRKLRRGGQYRGIPLLAPALPAYVDLKEILDNERINTKAQSTIWAFIQSPTGDSSDDEMAYPGLNVPANVDPGTGQTRTYKDLTPGTAMYGNPGEQPVFLKNERPSPAFAGLVKTLFMEIFCCSGVDYAFGYDASDLQGTAMRLTSAKTQRTFQQDWSFNEEYLFNPVVNRWLEFENENGYFNDLSDATLANRAYTNYSLTQPAHPSADVGRESQANLAELAAKIKSRHTIAVEQGLDWEVERQQLEKEDQGLSGGQVAIAESLAKSLGDQGLRALQTLAQSYGTGQITHDGAIGFATVILGLDNSSAEKLFPKAAEKPFTPPPGTGGSPTAEAEPGGDDDDDESNPDSETPNNPTPKSAERKGDAEGEFERKLSRWLKDNAGRWVTTDEGHKIHIDDKGKVDKGNPEVVKDANKGEESEPSLSSPKDYDKNYKSWTKQVQGDDDLKDHFIDFWSSGYKEINSNPNSKPAKAILSSLDKCPSLSSDNGGPTLYRGLAFKDEEKMKKFVSGLKSGGEINLTNTLTSFTGEESTARGFASDEDYSVMIEMPKYKNAKDLSGAGAFESEAVLTHGSKLRVVGSPKESESKSGRKIVTIQVEEI